MLSSQPKIASVCSPLAARSVIRINRRYRLASDGIKPFTQLRPAPPARDVLDGDRHRFLLPEQDDELLAAGDPGVKQIALQHHIVLRRDGNDDSGKFRALRFMDRRRVSEDDLVEFAEGIGDRPSVESDRHLAEVEIDGSDEADVAVVDLFVIVVLDLHDLVADGKRRPEFLDLWFSSRIESPLQFDIQRTGSEPAAVHWAEHLDVARRIQAEAAGDPV